MATKTPYYNDGLPTLRFPWGLGVSDFSELLLVSGHADVKLDNLTANYPCDLIAQTKFVLAQISKSVEADRVHSPGRQSFISPQEAPLNFTLEFSRRRY